MNEKDPKNRHSEIFKEIEAFFGKNYNSSGLKDEEIQVLHAIKTEFFRRRCAAHSDYGNLHITP